LGIDNRLKVFHLHVHFLYPIAFVLIVAGLFIYFLTEGVMVRLRSLGWARAKTKE